MELAQNVYASMGLIQLHRWGLDHKLLVGSLISLLQIMVQPTKGKHKHEPENVYGLASNASTFSPNT